MILIFELAIRYPVQPLLVAVGGNLSSPATERQILCLDRTSCCRPLEPIGVDFDACFFVSVVKPIENAASDIALMSFLPRVYCAGAHLKPRSKSMCVDVSGVPPSKLSIWQCTWIMLKLLGEGEANGRTGGVASSPTHPPSLVPYSTTSMGKKQANAMISRLNQ